MATKLESVVLHGTYKNQQVQARFDRYKRRDCAVSMGWTLAISIGGVVHRYTLTDKSLKPCWTVALRFLGDPLGKHVTTNDARRKLLRETTRRRSFKIVQ